MMLNAEQIIQKGLLKLDFTKGKPAQIGYDLSLKEVNRIGTMVDRRYTNRPKKIGKVLKDRTELTTYTSQPLVNVDGDKGWLLYPGVYDITFHEGCKIPSNYVGLIRQRSSMLRNGTVLHSSIFDPGYYCEFMGTVMVVNETIFIEEDARVGQIYFHECEEVGQENLYSGQWQGGLNDRPTLSK